MMRVLVTSTDERVLAKFVSLAPGCEVTAQGCDCLRRLREAPPDLLVLAPPVLWPSMAVVLRAISEEPALRHVASILLPPGRLSHRTVDMFREWLAGPMELVAV